MKRTQSFLQSLAAVLCLCVPSGTNDAAGQSFWTATSSGNWADSLNWLGAVPTIDLAAAITNGGTKVISISSATPVMNRAARRLDLYAPGGSTNTIRLDNLGAAPFQLANSFTLDAGSRLEVFNSLLVLDGSQGGSLNQFAGDILLAGGGIATTNSDPLALNGQPGFRIGRSGIGRAAVVAGEMIASDELIVGDLAGASGTLTLSNGLVRADGVFGLANNPGATGNVNVYGGTVISTNVTARIGDDGTGTLSQYGGNVIFDSASVGRGSNSLGRLHVRGGLMRPGTVSLGRFATAQGTLEVSGGTLDLAASSLYIGREGSGTAIFSNGTALVETVIIAASNTASGSLQLRGGALTTGRLNATRPSAQIQFSSGTLVVTQATTIANSVAFIIGNGTQPATLQLDGGTHSFANGLVISSNATLRGTGTVVGTITVLPGGSNQLGVAPTSVALVPALVNGQFRFSFPSATGRLYDILAATNLAAPVWQLQTTLAGTGAPLTYTNTSFASRRFFRVWIH